MASKRLVEFLRRLCREPASGWTPLGEPHALCLSRLDTAGYRGFSGYDMCQGPDAWPQGEVSIMRLDPDGCLVRRHRASDITIAEDTGAGEPANRQRDAMRHTSAKNAKGCVRGMSSL